MGPGSQRYQTLTETLTQIKDDLSSVVSILSMEPDQGTAFLQEAHQDLALHFAQGRLEEAESVAKLIAVVFDAQASGASGDARNLSIHQDMVACLMEGVHAFHTRDLGRSIPSLTAVTEQSRANEALVWVAWLWLSRVLVEQGDLAEAKEAGETALNLAVGIGSGPHSLSLCNIGEIELRLGEADKAQKHLALATIRFEELKDKRGLATAWMARARVHQQSGQVEEATKAATKATAADEEWAAPHLFLAEGALVSGAIEKAEEIVASLVDREPRPAGVSRTVDLIQLVKDDVVPADVVTSYVEMKREPASDDLVKRLTELAEANKPFLQLRELLAWTLLKRGHLDEASREFEGLATQKLDSELHQAVLLGLGVVANAKDEHGQPGGWIRNTSQVLSDAPAEPTVDLAKEDTEKPRRAKRQTSSEKQSPAVGNGAEASPSPAFTGTLQLFAVPDLLDFLKSSRRTGTLMVTSDAGIGAVRLGDGLITGAASPNCVTVGQLLLESGAVTEEQLADASASQKDESTDYQLIGSILVRDGVAEKEAVEGALATQIKSAIRELVGWFEGHFAFEPDRVSTEAEERLVDVALDTQSVVLDALRELDEQNKEG